MTGSTDVTAVYMGIVGFLGNEGASSSSSEGDNMLNLL